MITQLGNFMTLFRTHLGFFEGKLIIIKISENIINMYQICTPVTLHHALLPNAVIY